MNYWRFKQICEEWGKWATPRLGTEFPCVAVGIKGADNQSSPRFLPPISDEFGLLVDKLVLTMHHVAPEQYDAFMLRYVYRDEEAFKRMHISRKQFYIFLTSAEIGLKLMLAREDWVFN